MIVVALAKRLRDSKFDEFVSELMRFAGEPMGGAVAKCDRKSCLEDVQEAFQAGERCAENLEGKCGLYVSSFKHPTQDYCTGTVSEWIHTASRIFSDVNLILVFDR